MSDLALCRICGAETPPWWLRYAHPGSAATRCRDCYNTYCRLAWQKRNDKPADRGPRKPGKPYVPSVKLPCCDCGAATARRCKRCVACQLAKDTARRSFTYARRLAAERAGDSDISWRTLGERDGWQCHLCGKSVRRQAGTATQLKGATVDHLVPISCDGAHSWDNVALAHRDCNLRRRAGGEVQLRLVG